MCLCWLSLGGSIEEKLDWAQAKAVDLLGRCSRDRSFHDLSLGMSQRTLSFANTDEHLSL